jgi:hypothetical protein
LSQFTDRNHWTATAAVAVAVAILLAHSAVAVALPSAGTLRPALSLVDAEDTAFDLRGINGKPIVIVHESKEASSQNVAFKSDLGKLSAKRKERKEEKGEGYALIPIADADGYDYWPARGFVKSAIREESKKIGRSVYIDWGGSARKALGITQNKSAILIFGKDGKLKCSREGTLSKEDRDKAMQILNCEISACSADAENAPTSANDGT